MLAFFFPAVSCPLGFLFWLPPNPPPPLGFSGGDFPLVSGSLGAVGTVVLLVVFTVVVRTVAQVVVLLLLLLAGKVARLTDDAFRTGSDVVTKSVE